MIKRYWMVAVVVGGVLCWTLPAQAVTQVTVRWLKPSETGPKGKAPGAKIRLLAESRNGEKSYALVLARGDEVLSALADFARTQHVVSGHFTGIGAVRDPEVAWFDPNRKEYQAMSLTEQMEVLTLAGDIALGVDGQPVVHAHVSLGRDDGNVWGGHLLRATTSPTLEVFVTTYSRPLHKRLDPETGLQLIDPTLNK
jgi:predicted DNA-binding protein with PD1-like motif